MIPENELTEFRDAVLHSARPLIFFDDDPDGVCSFLQMQKLNSEAKGVINKATGMLDEQFLHKVEELDPDTVFILDVAEVSQEFLNKIHSCYWLDHHEPHSLKNVKYYNPMVASKGKDNRPTSYWAYRIAKKNLWLAMIGCVGDWFLPDDLKAEFSEKYPELLPTRISKPEDALFSTQLGRLARVVSFNLKGSTRDAMTSVKLLSKIEEPDEILSQSTDAGKQLWKKYLKIHKTYEEIKSRVAVTEEEVILFLYSEDEMSLTSDLSNEILYLYPDKFVIIG
ncbi:MAG: hypothetical protein HGA85_06165, partial [Nanoarchaeota archaeon]|nr:hypothetical protein [Nanoarchaeota archaeon]